MGQEGLHTEIRQGGAEKHRRQIAAAHPLHIQLVAGSVQKLDLLQELLLVVLSDLLPQGRILQVPGLGLHFLHAGVGRMESRDLLFIAVVDTLEILSAADGPVHRTGPDAQQLLDLVCQREGIPRFPVHLVDEGKDRDVPQGADLEQLPRLGLHALTGIDHHDRGIRRHQGAVGVLREILVAGCVQDVDAVSFVIELEHGRSDRDASLLLDVHPVADCVSACFSALDRSCQVDGAAVQKKLLRQRRLARVRMADDGKSTSFSDLFKIRHVNLFPVL